MRGLQHREQFNEVIKDKGVTIKGRRRPFTELRNDIFNTQMDGLSLDEVRDFQVRAAAMHFKAQAATHGFQGGSPMPFTPKQPRDPAVDPQHGAKVDAREAQQDAEAFERYQREVQRHQAMKAQTAAVLSPPMTHAEAVRLAAGTTAALGALAGGAVGGYLGGQAMPLDWLEGTAFRALTGSSTGAYVGRTMVEGAAKATGYVRRGEL